MPDLWEFLVRAVGQIQKLPPGYLVECRTDEGTVAVWGRSTNQTNIEKVRTATTPFRLRSNNHRTPNENFPHHAHWIPEIARIEITLITQTVSGGKASDHDEGTRSLPVSDKSPTVPGPVLYIVNCTKTKIWETNPSAHRFVPAADAYRGQSMKDWFERPEYRRGDRWLILSAKYGFIEPDHPIADYDVTFSMPETGPISDDALKAQVKHQQRFAEGIPLRHFMRVFVWRSETYVEKTRIAFEPVGATVEKLR